MGVDWVTPVKMLGPVEVEVVEEEVEVEVTEWLVEVELVLVEEELVLAEEDELVEVDVWLEVLVLVVVLLPP